MSRKARATARGRKRNRTASNTPVQARHATPVAATGARSSNSSGTHTPTTAARSHQPALPSAQVVSSGPTERASSVRSAQGSTRSPFTAAHPSSPAVAVTSASDSALEDKRPRYSTLSADSLIHVLAEVIVRLDVRDEVARQITLTRSIVARYLRSRWFVAEVVAIAVMLALCFGAPFDGAYFYRIAGLALGLFALFTTYVLDHAVVLPRTYLRRSLRAVGRPTVAPLVFAAAITRVVSFILLLALVLISRRFDSIEPLAILAGAVGLLANCALIAAVTVICSTPFARRGVQFGVLVWLVAALATYSPGTIVSSIPAVSWVLRLPLLPFAACYDVGVTGEIGWPGVAALVAEAGMIAAAVALADAGLRRRLDRREPSGVVR